MKTYRRAVAGMIALLAPCAVCAQRPADSYPARPVRIVVGLAPGGATDIQARLFAQKLSENIGRSFVVENRTGAGGSIAYAQVAKSPPDGYTLLAVASGFSITPAIYSKLTYDPVRDFAPISLVVQAPLLLLAHPSLPVKSVKELLMMAKARPGVLDFGSAGHGTSTGMALEMFRALANVSVTHVPYKGTGQALIETISGQVHAMFGNPLSSLQHVKTGRLRGLGVTAAGRSSIFPNLPTVAESGVPGYETSTWFGMLAPAGTPAAIIGKLNAELLKTLKAPDVVERLAPDGGEAVGSTPEQFAQHIATEIARWRKVARAAGVRIQ
ncbi:MAG: tripartite tricarboxylate transporter substrate binding protein [Betaproteobacteria bacterium]|nr:tripartite tricarboxylate transporter substrate binding protein [Betaproteobacteria bacterium]